MSAADDMAPAWWLIQFVYALERSYRRDGRSMVAEYAAALRAAEARAGRERGGYRAYLVSNIAHCRQALGLLVGRRGALAFQTGRA
jgi:hypothetical protein